MALETTLASDPIYRPAMGIIKDRSSKDGQYMTEVNKGSVNMSTLTDKLNSRYAQGWRLHTMLEQDGNTVLVFERSD